ncbi:MAG: sodium:solute symporter family transporter [Thermoguttaceae bacterium]|jgi:SSS family solute:Na+ symporter
MTNLLFAAVEMGTADVVVFFLFLAVVVFVAFGMSINSGRDSESYFLAGRGLKWWLIGFSLIAANISAEQFVGMSGQGADYIGLAVASYEWIAAVSLVIVAFFFLPKFLKAGIYTIPQYLETRYNRSARTVMSIFMMIMLVAVNITVVTYAGAKAYSVFFEGMTLKNINLSFIGINEITLNLQFFCWLIGIFAAMYIFAGGLKACAWADLLQGSALIVAGCIVLYFSMQRLKIADPDLLVSSIVPDSTSEEFATAVQGLPADAWGRFNMLNASKLRMNLPSWDLVIPVTALIIGIWIPNLYYWGLNQYIIQRTLGSKSLGEGQKGLVFAAFMKLLIPFIVIFPGMIAFNLFHNDMNKSALAQSASELARFEEASQGEPDLSKPLFHFNRSYVSYAPESARAMFEYDAQALGFDAEKIIQSVDREGMEIEDKYFLALTQLKKMAPEKVKFGDKDVMISGYDTDEAFPLLMGKVIPKGGFKGFMLAALLGAIISSVAAMLNAASTIFTMDIYDEYLLPKKVEGQKRQAKLVLVGRLAVVAFVLIGCLVAPIWADPKYGGVFKAIQEFQGYISPGIFAAFVVGFWMKKAPNYYGVVALVGCPVLYFLLAKFVPELDFLNRMAAVFGILVVLAYVMSLVTPRKTAFVQPVPAYPTDAELQAEIETALAAEGVSDEQRELLEYNRKHSMTAERWEAFLKDSKGAKICGIVVVVVTILLYIKYWA